MTIPMGFVGSQRAGTAFNPLTGIAWHTAAWLDDPSWTNPGNGNAIASLRDGSGNGHTMTSSGTNQPLFRASVAAFNNHAAVEFDGVNDYLGSASFTTVSQPFSAVWIGKRLGTGGGSSEVMIEFVNGVSPFTSMFMNISAGKWSAYANAGLFNSTTSYNTTAAHGIRVLFNGGSSVYDVDGSNTTGNPGASAATYFILGGDSVNAGNYANQQTAFAGLYAGDVTGAANWSAFVSWVSTYYGLTVA